MEGAFMPKEIRIPITIRVNPELHEKLQAAASICGTTTSQFVMEAALEKAEMMQSESQITLTRRESMRLLELLENPPPRNDKFRQAMARYQELISNDPSPDLK